MCVPKSEEELGCSFLGSPGKKAGQGSRNAAQLAPRLVQNCSWTLGKPTPWTPQPCLPPPLLHHRIKFRVEKGKKKKLHKNHAKRLECRLRWGECSGNCSVCCYSSTVHKPPMDKHFSALKHWGMAKHFPSEEFKGLTNPTRNSNIIVFPTGILANLVKSLQSDFGINCILISSIDNVISVGN